MHLYRGIELVGTMIIEGYRASKNNYFPTSFGRGKEIFCQLQFVDHSK